MKPDSMPRRVAIALVLAVAIYFTLYFGIEHLRVRKGPWRVTFSQTISDAPEIVINQPTLAITNVGIAFPGEPLPKDSRPATVAFGQLQSLPFSVPYGKCVFMDTTFQPGTVVFDLFGHEIQLMPRVLTIDHREHPWRSDDRIELKPIPPPQTNSIAPTK